MTDVDSDRDKLMGQTVARLRGDRTQQAVADMMRGRGFRWSQATVWSVEAGERPLRASEAEALADVLDIPVGAIFALPEDAHAVTYAEDVLKLVRKQLFKAIDGGRAVLHVRANVQRGGANAIDMETVEALAPHLAARLARLEEIDEHVIAQSIRESFNGPAADWVTDRLLDGDGAV